MSGEAFRSIETPLGIARGRDAFFVESFAFTKGLELKVTGEANADNCSGEQHGFVKYHLTFQGVLALRYFELDFAEIGSTYVSSFDEVDGSLWLQRIRASDSARKVSDTHRHYRLITYDDVFEFIASRYRFVLT